MPFGLVSKRYGGQVLTETPVELRGEIEEVRASYIKTAGYTVKQLEKK